MYTFPGDNSEKAKHRGEGCSQNLAVCAGFWCRCDVWSFAIQSFRALDRAHFGKHGLAKVPNGRRTKGEPHLAERRKTVKERRSSSSLDPRKFTFAEMLKLELFLGARIVT